MKLLYFPGLSKRPFIVTTLTDDEPFGAENDPEDPQRDCKESGSIVYCGNQILGERIGIPGTAYSLVYMSDRVPGRADAYRVIGRLFTNPELSEIVKAVVVEIAIDDRVVRARFDTAATPPGRYFSYQWDGLDGSGAPVAGAKLAQIAVGYVYDGAYAVPGDDAARSFGRLGAGDFTIDRARNEATLWRRETRRVGTWDARALGLGGFSLDIHHVYDPDNGMLFLGNGARIAGSGEVRGPGRRTMNTVPTDRTGVDLGEAMLDDVTAGTLLPDGGGVISTNAINGPARLWILREADEAMSVALRDGYRDITGLAMLDDNRLALAVRDRIEVQAIDALVQQIRGGLAWLDFAETPLVGGGEPVEPLWDVAAQRFAGDWTPGPNGVDGNQPADVPMSNVRNLTVGPEGVLYWTEDDGAGSRIRQLTPDGPGHHQVRWRRLQPERAAPLGRDNPLNANPGSATGSGEVCARVRRPARQPVAVDVRVVVQGFLCQLHPPTSGQGQCPLEGARDPIPAPERPRRLRAHVSLNVTPMPTLEVSALPASTALPFIHKL